MQLYFFVLMAIQVNTDFTDHAMLVPAVRVGVPGLPPNQTSHNLTLTTLPKLGYGSLG